MSSKQQQQQPASNLCQPSPVLRSYMGIVSSLDAIQKSWDETELKIKEARKRSSPRLKTMATEEEGKVTVREHTPELKHTELWTPANSSISSSDDVLLTPRTEEEEEEEEADGNNDEDDEVVAKIVANLEAKIRAVRKRKRLAVEVENLRRELAAKEVELKECDRILALEMAQVTL